MMLIVMLLSSKPQQQKGSSDRLPGILQGLSALMNRELKCWISRLCALGKLMDVGPKLLE